MEITFIRQQLFDILTKWLNGELSTKEVHEEAEEMVTAFEEWPRVSKAHANAIPLEILSNLEVLNYQLITQEDIPAMLKFLATPPGSEKRAWEEWERYWENIDLESRKRILSDNPYYLT
jgi:hypothetical protein